MSQPADSGTLFLILARGGSKRIPRKNIKPFAGRPMIAYPIQAAIDRLPPDQRTAIMLREVEGLSYKEIAEAIGQPSASRAVGGANGSNPIPIVIPCHRVIGKNGTLTGFGGGLDFVSPTF